MNTIDFLNRTSEKIGFKRERFDDAKVPTDFDDIIIIPIFADIRYSYVFSSFLLDGFKNKIKGSKYLIVCSYPGSSDFFCAADEFWSLNDFANLKNVFESSKGFSNSSIVFKKIIISLNESFRNVISPEVFNSYYYNGSFTDDFWQKYRNIESRYPMIQSSATLGKDFLSSINEKSGYKVFITPMTYGNSWYSGRLNKVPINKNFYINLIEFLNNNNIFPVVWNNYFSYNLTNDFKNTVDCLFLNTSEINKCFSCMRLVGCTLDLFGDISKLSLMARSPFVLFDERSKFFNLKDDYLYSFGNYGLNISNKLNFSFINNLNAEKNLKLDFFEILKSSIIDIFNTTDRDNWPTTSEIKISVPSFNLKRNKNKKFGTRFVKIKNTL